MHRVSVSLVALLLAGCSSLPTSELVLAEPTEAQPSAWVVAEQPAPATSPGYEVALPPPSTDAQVIDYSTALAVSPSLAAFAATPAQEESLHNSRFTIKAGLYSAEDAEELDDGFIVNVSWIQFFSKLFALEFELGYLDADGEDGGVEADVFAIPAMVNARLNLPIWVLDCYGGAGIGAFYYDAEVEALGLSDDDDGFLLGGNVFVGATINVADAVALGLEGKYYLSEDIDDFDTALDAFAVMATLGFSR